MMVNKYDGGEVRALDGYPRQARQVAINQGVTMEAEAETFQK